MSTSAADAAAAALQHASEHHIYEGIGEDMAGQLEFDHRLILLPDAPLVHRDPDKVQRIRILWGQQLIDDLIAGRYRSVVCAVNAVDNTHGIISHLAERMPGSEWREPDVTEHAAKFVHAHTPTVIKYDMGTVKVLALLRPSEHEHLTLDDVACGFRMIHHMLRDHPDRSPCASVSFLGARANRLIDSHGREPSLETVLDIMYRSGFRGDVYPAPWMWESAPRVFPRYPFPDSFRQMCDGGF
jgi:hypothetical protein